MSHFSVVSNLNTVATYPATPQVVVPFVPNTYFLRVETGAIAVLVSWDGIQDELRILVTDQLVPIPCKSQKVWLRQESAGVCTCRVSAFTTN